MTALSVLIAMGLGGCGGSKKNDGPPPSPPVKSEDVLVPFQLITVYKLERDGDGDFLAKASFYDATRTWDIFGEGGGVELTGEDAVFCDGQPLDTKTTTEVLHLVGLEYSRTIPKGKTAYRFELRRKHKQVLYVDVDIPEPFDITSPPIDAKNNVGSIPLTWSPVTTKGATMSVIGIYKEGGCGYAVISSEKVIKDRLVDSGSVSLFSSDFAAANITQDCKYDVRVERRLEQRSAGKWTIDGNEVPGIADIRIGLIHRETTTALIRP